MRSSHLQRTCAVSNLLWQCCKPGNTMTRWVQVSKPILVPPKPNFFKLNRNKLLFKALSASICVPHLVFRTWKGRCVIFCCSHQCHILQLIIQQILFPISQLSQNLAKENEGCSKYKNYIMLYYFLYFFINILNMHRYQDSK